MELLHVRHSLTPSNKQLVGGMFLLHKSKYFLKKVILNNYQYLQTYLLYQS